MKRFLPFFILLGVFFCSKKTGVVFETTSYADLLEKSKALGKSILVDVYSDG
ncbi:hypothetical protein JW935_07295 [candidate division KSB1 bacterium]|nr:hypothetical protein [candidate division KSB1 bacterium]